MAGNALPILLIGGAAALMLAGGKKKKKETSSLGIPELTPPPKGPSQSKPDSKSDSYVPMELAYLGYKLDGGKETIRGFQKDYNVVMMYQTNGKAKTFGVLLVEDGVIGPRTKDAIATAQSIQNQHGPWPEFVKKAAAKFGES